MVKSCVVGKYVFSISLIKYRTGTFFFELMCNFNYEQDHCPMASLNIGIGKHMFEVEVHYQDHRTDYDEPTCDSEGWNDSIGCDNGE